MKRAIPLLLLLAFVAYGAEQALAQGYNTKYTCLSTSVTSSTTPVTVLNVSEMTTWTIHARSGALGVLCFPYTAQSVPTAVPSPAAIIEVPAGANLSDAVNCDLNTCKDAIGAAWACVLTTGSTAVTVDSCYR
jgi:hypothetical protein